MKYEIIKLSELVDTISDTKKIDKDSVVLINTSDVFNGEVLNHEYVENNNLRGQFKKRFRKNDILYSEIRPANKRFAYVDFESDDYIASTKLMVLRRKSDKITNRYLYYCITCDSFIERMQHLAEARSGTFPQITFDVLKNENVKVPTIEYQNKICMILDNINNKIKINDKIKNNLNELIISYYSQYLNEMSDFEELDIREIFEFDTGVEPGSKNYLEKPEQDTVNFYRVGDMDSKCNTYVKKELTKGKYINQDDIVVSFDATIGRIGYCLEGSYSTGMKKISIKEKYKDIIDNSIVFAYFSDEKTKNIMRENAIGTTILHASSSIDYMKFKYNKELLQKYNNVISPLFEKMKQIKKENLELINLNMILMSQLMNCKIDLDNFEV